MKNLFAAFILLLSGGVNAGLISSDYYEVTELGGSWTYGYTDWNATSEYGTFGDDSSEYATIENILSDGYEYSCRSFYCSNANYVNGYNAIYSWATVGSSLTLEFSTAIALTSLEIITSRLYGTLSFEYFDGSVWQSLVASLGTYTSIGGSSDTPTDLMLEAVTFGAEFEEVTAYGLRLTDNNRNTAIHELSLFGEVAESQEVPEPLTLLMLSLGVLALGAKRRAF